MEYLKDLNSEQLIAVAVADGYVRVIAGAGSGKTRALTTRFAYLMNVVGVRPERILCVTFTNKAANAMKSRVRKIVGEEVSLPHIQTFHGFCNSFLREEIKALGFKKGYKILDETDQKALLRNVYDLLGVTPSLFCPIKECLESVIGRKVKESSEGVEPYIDYLKGKAVKDMWAEIPELDDTEDMIAKGYLAEQKSANCLDYDDLINFTLYILRHEPEVLAKWQKRFDYIQIDEFQDVNDKELEIVALLSAKKGNLFVVGDPDQCLYTFRGANVHCIVDFDKRVSEIVGEPIKSVTLYLNTNYRSTPEITKMANSLIRHNTIRLDKDLLPVRENGVIAEHRLLSDEHEEAEYIANLIAKEYSEGVKYSDIAVLYRTNFTSRVIEKTLFSRGIPYVLVKGTSFYARKEIKNILAILSLIYYGDDLSLVRMFKEIRMGIGAKKIMDLQYLSRTNGESMWQSLVRYRYDKKFAKAKDFIDLILKYRKAIGIKDNMVITGKANTNLGVVEEKEVSSAVVNEATEEVNNNEQDEGLAMYLIDGRVDDANWLSRLVRGIREDFNFDDVYAEEPEKLDNISEFEVAVKEFENLHKGEEYDLATYLEEISLFSTVEDNEGNALDKVQLMTVHAAKGLEFPVVIVAGMNQGLLPYIKSIDGEGLEEERRICYVAMTRAENKLYLTSHRGYNFTGDIYRPSQFLYEIPASFFKSNLGGRVTEDFEIRKLLDKFNPELKVAFGQLSDSQIDYFVKTYRLLTHCCTYYEGCDITEEFQLNLLRFMRSLNDTSFEAWYDTVNENTYRGILTGEIPLTTENNRLEAEDAINLLLNVK